VKEGFNCYLPYIHADQVWPKTTFKSKMPALRDPVMPSRAGPFCQAGRGMRRAPSIEIISRTIGNCAGRRFDAGGGPA